MMPDRLEAVLLDFDHTLTHMGRLVRWEDARHELLPLYRACGVPEPSPEGLLRCCEAMSVTPQRCIYAGDIEAVRTARMAGIGVRAGNSSHAELTDAGAAAVFDDLGGLMDVLERR